MQNLKMQALQTGHIPGAHCLHPRLVTDEEKISIIKSGPP